MPPATARYARTPAPSIRPSFITSPAATSNTPPSPSSSPFRHTFTAAPVTAIRAAALNRSVGPLIVISSPGTPSALPTSRFANRNASASNGPDGGTPTSQ